MKKVIKKLVNLAGYDIHKIHPNDNNKNIFVWLKDYNIKTILDIGANEGQFALQINKFLPDAQIYSFEPLQNIFPILIKNTKKINNIIHYNIALGDFTGKSIIYSNEFSPASSLLKITDTALDAFKYIGNSSEEEIEVYRLDDLTESKKIIIIPELFIKMDVQGFEDRVILGGMKTFQSAKLVLTEVEYEKLYENQTLFDDIYYALHELNFRFKGIIYTELHPESGIPLFGDAIFLRNT